MRKYLVIYEKTKTGYSAYAPDLPGVIATGKSRVIDANLFIGPVFLTVLLLHVLS